MKSEVRIKKTLKFGHGDSARIYLEGETIRSPLPPELLKELNNKSGTVVWVEDDTPHDPRQGLAREVFKPHFPKGDYVQPPKRPPAPAQEVAKSKSQGVIVPASAPKVKKPVVIRAEAPKLKTVVERVANESGKVPEKPKVKLSLRTR